MMPSNKTRDWENAGMANTEGKGGQIRRNKIETLGKTVCRGYLYLALCFSAK